MNLNHFWRKLKKREKIFSYLSSHYRHLFIKVSIVETFIFLKKIAKIRKTLNFLKRQQSIMKLQTLIKENIKQGPKLIKTKQQIINQIWKKTIF